MIWFYSVQSYRLVVLSKLILFHGTLCWYNYLFLKLRDIVTVTNIMFPHTLVATGCHSMEEVWRKISINALAPTLFYKSWSSFNQKWPVVTHKHLSCTQTARIQYKMQSNLDNLCDGLEHSESRHVGRWQMNSFSLYEKVCFVLYMDNTPQHNKYFDLGHYTLPPLLVHYGGQLVYFVPDVVSRQEASRRHIWCTGPGQHPFYFICSVLFSTFYENDNSENIMFLS